MKYIAMFLTWTWCLPQTLVGLLYKKIKKNDIWREENLDNSANLVFFKSKDKFQLVLGKYIFMSVRMRNKVAIDRQKRAYLLNLILGPLYLPVYALIALARIALK